MFIEKIDCYGNRMLCNLSTGTGLGVTKTGENKWSVAIYGCDTAGGVVATGTKNEMESLYNQLYRKWVAQHTVAIVKDGKLC